MSVAPPPTGLERLFRVEVLVGPIEDHGMTSAGHRRVVPIVGGRIFDGVDAEVLPGGADWQVVRPDGAIEIDTRYTARTADGALLHLRTPRHPRRQSGGARGAAPRHGRARNGVLVPAHVTVGRPRLRLAATRAHRRGGRPRRGARCLRRVPDDVSRVGA